MRFSWGEFDEDVMMLGKFRAVKGGDKNWDCFSMSL